MKQNLKISRNKIQHCNISSTEIHSNWATAYLTSMYVCCILRMGQIHDSQIRQSFSVQVSLAKVDEDVMLSHTKTREKFNVQEDLSLP